MAGRARERCSRFNSKLAPRSRPSTSRGGGGYSDRHNQTFKSSNCGVNHFRKSWKNKSNLVRDQLNSEFLNRNGQSRNNSGGRRSFLERNNSYCNNNFRNSQFILKESFTGWYLVLVPNVDDCDEVLKIIQTYITPISFYPYNKQFFGKALKFMVDDFKIAKTLHNTSYKITLRDDRKLVIKVYPFLPAHKHISFTPVSTEVREKIVEAMATRYNSSTKSLDLSQFYACPLFTENQLFVPLNRPAVLLAALNMVAQYTKHDLYCLSLENNHIYLGEGLIWIRRLFPELKVLDLAGNKLTDLKMLKHLSGFTIEYLNLSRNPVCDTDDKERYRRDIQQLFPILNKLDNEELPSKYSASIFESKFKMPVNQGNNYPIPEGHNPEQPNPAVTLVESFLSQYYERYDNQISRQSVGEAYHENASFTLSSGFLSYVSKSCLSQYLSEGRNFLKVDRNRGEKNCFLHKGRKNVIHFLEKLPKTKHDLGSFLVDVPLANAAMIQIVVNGVFAEDFKETDTRTLYRSFSRTFCIVPVGDGWSILSDMLFVTTVTDELLLESSKRFYCFKVTSAVSKKNNSNDSSDNSNSIMSMENSEMFGLEASSLPYQQPATPNYPPRSYQQTFSSFQPAPVTAPINVQQPSQSYHDGIQNQPTTLQQSNHLVAKTSFQQNMLQSNISFPVHNSTPTATEFSTSSTPIQVNEQSNNDKSTLIRTFSHESGMHYEWAKKCLEENDWDYTKAALCFSILKDNIPSAAFVR